MIDVSQSVEHDHPHALEFLRKDCTNITGNKSSQNQHYSKEILEKEIFGDFERDFEILQGPYLYHNSSLCSMVHRYILNNTAHRVKCCYVGKGVFCTGSVDLKMSSEKIQLQWF